MTRGYSKATAKEVPTSIVAAAYAPTRLGPMLLLPTREVVDSCLNPALADLANRVAIVVPVLS